jgi:hypothetical protein
LNLIFVNIIPTKISKKMAHNVPVVCDVFLRPKKKPRSGYRAQKNVPEKNRTKARSADCGFS